MNKRTTYEAVLAEDGRLIYSTSGGSMRPFIRPEGDAVVILARGKDRCKLYDAVLYRRDNGQYVLHRIVAVERDTYVLQGDNCRQREPGIREDQILGILTGIIREGKTLDVNTPVYRRKVRLWCALRPVGLMATGRNLLWSIKKRLK